MNAKYLVVDKTLRDWSAKAVRYCWTVMIVIDQGVHSIEETVMLQLMSAYVVGWMDNLSHIYLTHEQRLRQ